MSINIPATGRLTGTSGMRIVYILELILEPVRKKISNYLIFEETFTPHLVPPPTHKVRGGRKGGGIFEQAH